MLLLAAALLQRLQGADAVLHDCLMQDPKDPYLPLYAEERVLMLYDQAYLTAEEELRALQTVRTASDHARTHTHIDGMGSTCRCVSAGPTHQLRQLSPADRAVAHCCVCLQGEAQMMMGLCADEAPPRDYSDVPYYSLYTNGQGWVKDKKTGKALGKPHVITVRH